LTRNAVSGVATFNDLVSTTSGPIALDVSSGNLTKDTPSSVTVSPATPAKLVIQTQPSQTATAGQPFATQPAIDVEDQYGNRETGDNATVVTAALGSGTGPLLGTTTATATGGVATFTDLFDKTAETITLSFTGAGLTSATFGNI